MTEKKERMINDDYPTPTYFARAIFESAKMNGLKVEGKVLESCAGSGQLALAIKESFGDCEVITNELLMKYNTDHHIDACDDKLYELVEPDWIVTNPPFSKAEEILKKSLKHAKKGVVLILRISFLEPTASRADVLSKHPPTTLCFPKRVKFREDTSGSDSVTTALIAWEKGKYHTDVSFVSDEDLVRHGKIGKKRKASQ